MKNRHVSGVVFAACVGTAFTVLSQIIPAFQFVYAVIWIALITFCGVGERGHLRLSQTFLWTCGLFFFFVIYCAACMFLTEKPDYVLGYPIILAKALLMYVVGYFLFFRAKEHDNWGYILAVYIASTFVYGVWVIATYVPSLSAWLTSQVYLFDSKNSFGQIAGVASFILIVATVQDVRLMHRVLFSAIACILALMALLVQCRTALIALIAAVVVLLCCIGKKRVLLIAAICMLIAIVVSPTLQTYVSHALFLDKYEGTDLDTFSSGRLGLWEIAMNRAGDRPMIGLGSFYVDCFYINTYANVGIFGSVLVFLLWGLRITQNMKQVLIIGHKSVSWKWLRISAAALTVFYLIESALEGYPPFGPGACSFLFWMLCGYLDAALQDTSDFEERSFMEELIFRSGR